MTPVPEMVDFIVHRLVQHPDDVVIETTDDGEGSRIQLKVHAEDMGRVIGRSGRTAKALRTLVSTAAGKAGAPVLLDIVE
jgi:predicted RNA-binding protein YlqC (UPF0109 family)